MWKKKMRIFYILLLEFVLCKTEREREKREGTHRKEIFKKKSFPL